MQHVDALSRMHSRACLQVGETINVRLQTVQDKDEGLRAIKKLLKKNRYEDYAIENKLLYKGKEGMRKLVVTRGMANEIINWVHRVGLSQLRRPWSWSNEITT